MSKRKVLIPFSICFVLVLVISIFLPACTKSSSPPSPTSSPSPTTSPAPVTYKWKLPTWCTRGDVFRELYHKFAVDVADMSNGRILIEDVYEGEGFKAADIHTSVSRGLFEIGAPNPAYSGNLIVESDIELGLPGSPLEYLQAATLWYEGGWMEVFRTVYAKHNMYYLSTSPQPGGVLITNSPVKTLDDVKAMKIRAPGAYGTFWNKLGAATVTVPFSEVYTSFATKVINGNSLSNILDIQSAKFYEVAPHLYPLPVAAMQSSPIVVNMDVWKKLSKDL